MAFHYGRRSLEQRNMVYPWLQLILEKTLAVHDHSIDQGGRSDEQQREYHRLGVTTLLPPDGKHLLKPDPTGQFFGRWSFAVDCCPYINGRRLATDKARFGPNQRAQFTRFLAIVEQIGRDVLADTGWALRFGINWDMDEEILTDQTFQDFYHIETVRI